MLSVSKYDISYITDTKSVYKDFSRGFVYVRESEDLMEEARQVVTDAVEDCLNHQRNADWSKIKLVIRDTMNEFIWKKTKRRPMILPIIMDV